MDNRELYSTVALGDWTDRTGLTEAESFLVGEFLNPDLSVVEAGTGGGRILFELQRLGFTDLYGFDYVAGMIDAARRRDPAGSIDFSVGNAVQTDYADASFDQALYLQQVLCLIDRPEDRAAALREARRILKPGGTALFSFLCFETRMRHLPYAGFTLYLELTRRLRHGGRGRQSQPWLRHGGRPNYSAVLDRPPHVYWYRIPEALAAVRRAGFRVTAAAVESDLRHRELSEPPDDLDGSRADGMLYVVARRPSNHDGRARTSPARPS